MPISWNEIRHNAVAFAKDWAGVSREDAEAKTFWDEFFKVFGIKRRTGLAIAPSRLTPTANASSFCSPSSKS
jgi:hypothetical protein